MRTQHVPLFVARPALTASKTSGEYSNYLLFYMHLLYVFQVLTFFSLFVCACLFYFVVWSQSKGTFLFKSSRARSKLV
jgi:hypothetical protein